MDYLLLGYLVTFSLIVIVVLRHYTHRMGLTQLSEFIKDKEYELNSKLVSGLAELEDISINLEVDVKKYHHLKHHLGDYMSDLDKRKHSFDTTFKKVDSFFEAIRKQHHVLERAGEKNERLLAQLRTSEDTIKLYEERVLELAKTFQNLQTDMKTYVAQNTKDFTIFTQQQDTALEALATGLKQKMQEKLHLSEQTLKQDLRQLEEQLGNKLETTAALGTEQGKIIEANLDDFAKNIKTETQKHLHDERNHYLKAKESLVKDVSHELDVFATSVSDELKQSQDDLEKMKDQITLAGDLLAPYEERIDVIEGRIETWETEWEAKTQHTDKWIKAFTKQKDQFMKQTFATHLQALETEFKASSKTLQKELSTFQTTKKQEVLTLVTHIKDHFSEELKREVLSPERIDRFETAFVNAKEELASIEKRLAQFKADRQADIKIHQTKLLGLMTEHEKRAEETFAKQLRAGAEFFKSHEATLEQYIQSYEKVLKEMEQRTKQTLETATETKFKQFNDQTQLTVEKHKDGILKFTVLQSKLKSYDQQTQALQEELAGMKVKFVAQLRKRDDHLARLETEHNAVIEQSLEQAQGILKNLFREKQQRLGKLLQNFEKQLNAQGTTLHQFQNVVEKKLTPELRHIKEHFQTDLNALVDTSRAQIEAFTTELKQKHTNILSTGETQQGKLIQDLERQVQVQLKDWEANMTAKIAEFEDNTADQTQFVRTTSEEFKTFQSEVFPALTERCSVLEEQLKTLETSHDQYDQIFKESSYYKQDLKKLMEDITEKLHQDVEQFSTWMDSERTQIEDLVAEKLTNQTEIKETAQAFQDYLAGKRTEIEKLTGREAQKLTGKLKDTSGLEAAEKAFYDYLRSRRIEIEKLTGREALEPLIVDFSKFLQEKKSTIHHFIEQKLNHLQDLNNLDDLAEIVKLESHDGEGGTKQIRALFTTEKDGNTANPTLRGMLGHWLEPKSKSQSHPTSPHQTKRMLQDFEKRVNAKLHQFEKVYTLESDFTDQAKRVETNFVDFFNTSKRNVLEYITGFKKQLKTESEHLRGMLSERLTQYNQTHHEHLEHNRSASEERFNVFLQSSREEFLNYRNAVIEDYTSRINDQLRASHEKLDKYLYTFEDNLKQNIQKLLKKQNTQLDRSHKDYQKSAGKLQQFNSSVNAVAVMEAKQEKLLKTAQEQYEKLKQQIKEFMHGHLRTEKLNALLTTELETALRVKAKRIETQFLKHSDLKTELVASVKEAALQELSLNNHPGLITSSATQAQLPLNANQTEQLTQKLHKFVRAEVENKVAQKVTDEVTQNVTDNVTEQVAEKATRKVTQKATEKVTATVTQHVTQHVTATVTKKLTEQMTEHVRSEVTQRVTQEIAKEMVTSAEHLKKLTREGNALMHLQKRRVTKWMTETQKTIVTNKEALLAEFSKKLFAFDKELAHLVKKVKSFTEQTKVFEEAQSLSTRLSEKINAYEHHLTQLSAKEKQIKAIDTKVTKTIDREKDLLLFAKDLKQQEGSVKKIAEKLEHTFKVSEQLTEQMDALKTHQQAFEDFSNETKTYETTLNHFKEEFSQLRAKDGFLKDTRVLLEKLLAEQKGLSVAGKKLGENLNITAERERAIRDKFRALEEQAEILENHYKDFKVFDEKYNQLDYLIEDLEQRKRSIEEMRKRLTLERGELEALKKDFNDQISVVLKALYQRQPGTATTSNAAHNSPAQSPKATSQLDKITTVERLKAIGWSNREIASHLNMQTYEVEIILKKDRN